MRTHISRINGKDYLYAYDSIFVASGKTLRKTKSLGRVDVASDLTKKEQSFRKYIEEEEVRMRMKYWVSKVRDPKFGKFASIEKIESVRSSLYRAKESMGGIATGAMETAFLVDFIYNSNRLEGSRIPREQVEEEVRNKKARKQGEVANTIKSLHEVSVNFDFNVKRIVALHAILMAHEPEKIGLRHTKVVVGDSEVAPWQEVRMKLHDLCKWYKEAKSTMYPPELAFDFYYKFERIHPFVDGNGRTGRLIMNRILQDHRYNPMIISWKRKQAQETAFKKRIEGRSEHFYKFMAEEFIVTHEIYTSKISDAFNLERLSDVFLTPSAHYAS